METEPYEVDCLMVWKELIPDGHSRKIVDYIDRLKATVEDLKSQLRECRDKNAALVAEVADERGANEAARATAVEQSKEIEAWRNQQAYLFNELHEQDKQIAMLEKNCSEHVADKAKILDGVSDLAGSVLEFEPIELYRVEWNRLLAIKVLAKQYQALAKQYQRMPAG